MPTRLSQVLYNNRSRDIRALLAILFLNHTNRLRNVLETNRIITLYHYPRPSGAGWHLFADRDD